MSIRLTNLTKSFGDRVGLNRVDWEIQPGLTAIVGPNGSGKSTLMRVISGHSKPTGGHVTVFGENPFDNPSILGRIGYVPEQDAFYTNMTGPDFVAILAQMNGMEKQVARARAREILADLGMRDGFDRRIKTYSKGMRQRVKVAQAIIHDPDILLLDEPMLGCDPPTRQIIHDFIKQRAKDGATVLMSTHLLPEVERITKRVAFLSNGKLRRHGELESLRDQVLLLGGSYRIHTPNSKLLAKELVGWDEVESVRRKNDLIDVQVTDRNKFLDQFHGDFSGTWKVRGFSALDSGIESIWSELGGEA